LTVIVAIPDATEALIPSPVKFNIVALPCGEFSSLILIAFVVAAPAALTVPQLQFPKPSAIGT
jgi:hypothetical protein